VRQRSRTAGAACYRAPGRRGAGHPRLPWPQSRRGNRSADPRLTKPRHTWELSMVEKNILHMITPTKHISPFDANMALDAGYDAVLPYGDVTLDEVTALVQDAIFSRPPKTGVRTAMFFGGKNPTLALDMLAKAKKALVPPFGMSFFADPAGSFTTAAAMVACVEKILKEKHRRRLDGLKVAIFGATGVVGYASAVIAALERSSVTIVGYDGIKRVTDSANEIR